jgi:thiol-disulfide isomerase/thioredoxin
MEKNTSQAMLSQIERVVVAALVVLLLFTENAAPGRHAAQGLPSVPAPPKVGAVAPDFELKVLEGKGKTLRLSDLKGKAVLLDFWATYCEPCKVEMPWIAELQKKYEPEGFQVVGVSMDDEAEERAISEFTRKMGVNYPIVIGSEKVADLYGGLDGLPMNVFLDRSGKIVASELGLTAKDVFEDNIKKSLAQEKENKIAPPQ